MSGPLRAGQAVVPGRVVAAGPATVGDGPTVVAGTATTGGGGHSQIADVTAAPVGAPVVLVRGSDGLFRPDPVPAAKAAWSDPVRWRAGPPADDPTAPEGAVYIDVTTGRGYRRREED